MGGLDVVVNVVGISGRSLGDGPVHECTDEGWDRVIEVNLRSVFLVCRAAIPLLEAGSSIVNITSVLGLTGDASGTFVTHAYAASKGGVISLTRAMAATYASQGIRVNAVAPGLVRSGMSQRAQGNEEVLRVAGARQPLTGPLIEPELVARAIAFLSSPAAEGITGTVLPIDGGWLTT
jgi:NAD(P)-dependent dehydrogenase (short-subunit alcohol dehydrogenase family)